MIRPRRSVLFMPGSNARALDKAQTLPADGLILDLEDAVAPDAKQLARDQIESRVAAKAFGKREVMIRINALDTGWWRDDLAMAAKAKPDAIVAPKISSADDVAAIASHLDDAGHSGIKIWAMVETALAVLRIGDIAAQARLRQLPLAGFIMGPNDLARETRIRITPGRTALLPAYMQCIVAARAYGFDILDGPYGDINNIEGLQAECVQSRDMGFDGKTLIHPRHIETCNRVFTPADEEVAAARKIVDAFSQAENAGRGAIQIDGRMVERLHAQIAERTLAMADAIAALN